MVTKPTKAPLAAPRLSQNCDNISVVEEPPVIPRRPLPPTPVVDRAPPRPPKASPPASQNSPRLSTSDLLRKKIPCPPSEDSPILPPRHEDEPPALPDRPKKPTKLYENCDVSSQKTDTQIEDLKKFALKRNFSEQDFQRAFERSSGIPTDTNIFMATLLAVTSENSTHQPNLTSSSGPASLESWSSIPDSGDQYKSIVLDGSNIAMTHGNGVFSFQGIKLAVDWFQQRGHRQIKVVLPRSRKDTANNPEDILFLENLESTGSLIYTPITQSPTTGSTLNCYDDRFILDIAAEDKAVVVSNDLYRDLAKENPAYWETIAYRLLGFTFSENRFMPPEDPLGKRGPTLDQFLRPTTHEARSGQQCPYGRKCTYGSKCRYTHHERSDSAIPTIPAELWKSNKHSEYDQELERFKKKATKLQQERALRQYQQKYPLPQQPYQSDFSNHPSNIAMQPIAVHSRCVGETGPSSAKDQSSHSAGSIPGSVKLRVDTNGHQWNNSMMMRQPLHMSMPAGFQQQGNRHFQHQHPYPFQAVSLPHHNSLDAISLPMSQSSQATSGYDISSITDSTSASSMERPSFVDQSDPRYNTYFHLSSLFPEYFVRKAMIRLPNETDPQVICRVIMQLSQNHDANQ